MTLTDEQKLEMTETIARACGWKPDEYRPSGISVPGVKITRTTVACEIGPFNPLTDANDFDRACKALGVKFRKEIQFSKVNRWSVTLLRAGNSRRGKAESLEQARFMALVEIAKAKLEDDAS